MNRLKQTGICIPTYNAMSFETFPNLIKLLLAIKSDLGKILIIDSSSEDNTVGFINEVGLEVLLISRKEFDHGSTRAMAVNILSEKYSLKYAIFLTQDALLVSEESIYNIITPFNDNLVGAVCGRQIPHDNANILARHSRLFNYPSISRVNTKSNIDGIGIKTAFMSNSFAAYNIKLLQEVNGFPENIILGEDLYVSAKMILKGYKTFYCSDSIVQHSHNYSLIEEFQRYFDIGVSHASSINIIKQFKSPNHEGLRYLISEISYTIKNYNLFWFCNSLIRNFLKFTAYKLGKNSLMINKNLRKKISLNPSYWDKVD